MRFDANRLRIFHEAVRARSYTTAARRLHVTQSAVSHAIRKLEQEVGRPLVQWQGRRMALTDEGAYLAQSTEEAFRQIEQAERHLSPGAGGVVQSVTLGATTGFGPSVLLGKLRPLLETEPRLRLDFHFHHELEAALLDDAIDIAVDCKPHLDPRIEETPLFVEHYVLVAADALLERTPIHSPADLARVPLISFDRQGYWWRDMIRSLPPEERLTPRRYTVVDDVRGMGHAAALGYGVALVPRYSVLDDIASGRLQVVLPDRHLPADRFAICQKRSRAQRPKNRLVTEFLLRMEVSEFGDALQPSADLRGEGEA